MTICRTPINDSVHQYITDLGKTTGGTPTLGGLTLILINFGYKTTLIPRNVYAIINVNFLVPIQRPVRKQPKSNTGIGLVRPIDTGMIATEKMCKHVLF